MSKNDYCQKACGDESSYCITWKNPQVCHGCNKLCGSGPPKPPGPKPPGPKPPGPKPPGPKTDTCATKCGTGSYSLKLIKNGCRCSLALIA